MTGRTDGIKLSGLIGPGSMTASDNHQVLWALVDREARTVEALGREAGLPFIAVSADIGSTEPMLGRDGRPLAETLFQWIDPDLAYWRDRGFALRAPFVLAARYMAEPFFYGDGRFATWRPSAPLDAIEVAASAAEHGVASAIIAPVHLPGGAIAAVVWATPDAGAPVAERFAAFAPRMHHAAIRLTGAYQEVRGAAVASPIARLTRREIQCLKWAAAGKTDALIAELMSVSAPTVRFHMKNAAQKLGAYGRSQTVRAATMLGYVSGPTGRA